jgi:hypothetical protein
VQVEDHAITIGMQPDAHGKSKFAGCRLPSTISTT